MKETMESSYVANGTFNGNIHRNTHFPKAIETQIRFPWYRGQLASSIQPLQQGTICHWAGLPCLAQTSATKPRRVSSLGTDTMNLHIQLVVEPTQFETYANVELDHFPKVGKNNKSLKPPRFDKKDILKWPMFNPQTDSSFSSWIHAFHFDFLVGGHSTL